MYAEFEGYWSIDENGQRNGQCTSPPSAVAREKGTEMLCRGLMSMVYGQFPSNLSAKDWLESSLDDFFDTYDLEGIKKTIKNYHKVLKLSREILGENRRNNFRRNNLASGRWSKVSKTMIEPVSYVFSKLKHKYSSGNQHWLGIHI